VSGGLFDLFQMSPEEEDVLVLLLEDSDTIVPPLHYIFSRGCPEQKKSPMASASSCVTFTHLP
jgi:hypothetical protein